MFWLCNFASVGDYAAREMVFTPFLLCVTLHSLERSLDGQTEWIVISVLPENSVVHSDTGLFCRTEYYFRVRAFRDPDGLYSPYSNTVKAMKDPCV
jgi:hypothetical protein